MTYNVFGGTLNLAQFNSIQFNSVGVQFYWLTRYFAPTVRPWIPVLVGCVAYGVPQRHGKLFSRLHPKSTLTLGMHVISV